MEREKFLHEIKAIATLQQSLEYLQQKLHRRVNALLDQVFNETITEDKNGSRNDTKT